MDQKGTDHVINEQYSPYARYPMIPNSFNYFYSPPFGPPFPGGSFLRSPLPHLPTPSAPMHPMQMHHMFPASLQANPIQNLSGPVTPIQNLSGPVTPMQNLSGPVTPIQNLSVPSNPLQNLSVKAESSVTPPLSQRKPKRTVPDDEKDDKYRAKRCKNNDAAKKSRETRRKKEEENENVLKSLEETLEKLKNEYVKVENSTNGLKSAINEMQASMSIHMMTSSARGNYPPMTSSNN